jgi:hypothetical protein
MSDPKEPYRITQAVTIQNRLRATSAGAIPACAPAPPRSRPQAGLRLTRARTGGRMESPNTYAVPRPVRRFFCACLALHGAGVRYPQGPERS